MPKISACRIFAIVTGLLVVAIGAVVAVTILIGEKGDGLRIFAGQPPPSASNSDVTAQSGTGTTSTPALRTTAAPTAAPTASPTEYVFPFNQCDDGTTRCCNGLGNLCDWPVNEVLFGVVHNAMSSKEDNFYLPNNLRPLEDALEAGYRGVALDLCHCNGHYVLCHGFCGLGERDPTEVFTNLVTFLDEHPSDVVVVTLQMNSDAGEDVDLNQFDEQILSNVPGLKDLLYQQEQKGDPWPTLGNMVEANDRILFFHFNGPACDNLTLNHGGCPRGLHYYFDYAVETEFEFTTVANIQDTANSCKISRGTSSSTGDFFGVNNFVTVLSTTESKEASLQLNQKNFVHQRIADCTDSAKVDPYNPGTPKQGDVNFLYVDFWSIGDIVEVVQTHNLHLGLRNARSG